MERKLKPIFVQQSLQAKGVRLFSPADFQRVFGVSLRATREFIKDHCEDLFLKIRNGLYALARYSIIPESVYTITSATTRITREFSDYVLSCIEGSVE